MGNGVSVDQGNLPSYGSGDVSDVADRKQHDWSQLADAPIIEQPSSALWSLQQSYIGAQRGARSRQSSQKSTHVQTLTLIPDWNLQVSSMTTNLWALSTEAPRYGI